MDPPVKDEEIDVLRADIEAVLEDVAVAVADWEPMRARLAHCITQLEQSRLSGVKGEERKDAIEFLKWLWDNRFAFLGVRHFSYAKENGSVRFEHDLDQDLGILRDPDRRVLNTTFQENGELSPSVAAFLDSSEPINCCESQRQVAGSSPRLHGLCGRQILFDRRATDR